jgi:NADH-quinone oxidoreductase subunit L
LWKICDNIFIDGLINWIAKQVDNISANIRKIQTGVAQSYALVMVLGILIALFWIILSV